MSETADSYFRKIMAELFETPYYRTQRIQELEKAAIKGLNDFPVSLPGHITYLQALAMLGHKEKAVFQAQKIWEMGGQLAPEYEASYIDTLINLGLKDMVEILLHPRYNNIEASYALFGRALEKFALQQGNFFNLTKVQHLAPEEKSNKVLGEILNYYRQNQKEDNFSNVMKIIFETSHEQALAYKHFFYTDRGFPEMETVVYTNQDADNGGKFERYINKKIDSYYASINQPRINNISVRVLMVSEHPALYKSKQSPAVPEDLPKSQYNPEEWGF